MSKIFIGTLGLIVSALLLLASRSTMPQPSEPLRRLIEDKWGEVGLTKKQQQMLLPALAEEEKQFQMGVQSFSMESVRALGCLAGISVLCLVAGVLEKKKPGTKDGRLGGDAFGAQQPDHRARPRPPA